MAHITIEEARNIAVEQTAALTQKAENWTKFLDTSANMYKYPYSEQLLIHVQQPDATACASEKLWREHFGRRVKDGAEGITLIETRGTGDRLRYIFDITDTEEPEQGGEPPYIWQMKAGQEAVISQSLKEAYSKYDDLADFFFEDTPAGINESGNQAKPGMQVVALAARLAEERVENSEYTLSEPWNLEAWTNILTHSVAYVVLSRCGAGKETLPGLSLESLTENFKDIGRIQDAFDITDLGEATQELSREILSHIEKTVNNEREKERQSVLANEKEPRLSADTEIDIPVRQPREEETISAQEPEPEKIPDGPLNFSSLVGQTVYLDRDAEAKITGIREADNQADLTVTVNNAGMTYQMRRTMPLNVLERQIKSNPKNRSIFAETPREIFQNDVPRPEESDRSDSNTPTAASAIETDFRVQKEEDFSIQEHQADYAVGDAVYLDDGREYTIAEVGKTGADGEEKVELYSMENRNGLSLPINYTMNRENFERQFYNHLFNQTLIAERQNTRRGSEREKTQADAQSVADESEDSPSVRLNPQEETAATEKTTESDGKNVVNNSERIAAHTRQHQNFRALATFASEIIDGEAGYIRFTAGKSFMPLSVEKLSGDRLAVAHYYEQNGDMTADPDMVFVIDKEAGTLSARAFQDVYGYRRAENENGEIADIRLARELDNFTQQWFSNISEQNYHKERIDLFGNYGFTNS